MSLEKVSDGVKALALNLQSGLTFDGEGIGILAADVFEKHLPEGLTMHTVKQVQDTLLDFSDAATLAVAESGIDHLKAHKDLSSVSLKVKAGRDAISTSFERSRDMRNPGTGAQFTKFGISSTKLVSGVGGNRQGYKQIKEYASEKAASVFAQ